MEWLSHSDFIPHFETTILVVSGEPTRVNSVADCILLCAHFTRFTLICFLGSGLGWVFFELDLNSLFLKADF